MTKRVRFFLLLCCLLASLLLCLLSVMMMYDFVVGTQLISDRMFLLGGISLLLVFDLVGVLIFDSEKDPWRNRVLNFAWFLFGVCCAAAFLI